MTAEQPIESVPFVLSRRLDAPPIGVELEALATFRVAARRLLAADTELAAARQAYAEAIKALSAAVAP